MIRVNPVDVLEAFKKTGLVPVRLAWQSQNPHGGCALETLSLSHGIACEDFISALDQEYLEGFVHAWDSDKPELDTSKMRGGYLKGYWDSIRTRDLVTSYFSSELVPVIQESNTD